MSEDVLVVFDRSGEQVCARLHLALDITLELWSDEPVSPRLWEFDLVELDVDVRPSITLQFPRGRTRLGPGKLLDFLTREWDREIEREAKRTAGAQDSLSFHAD